MGYMALHYGADYLRESLLSVIDLCDCFVILYTPKPSYGFGTNAVCPETEEELRAIAQEVCGNKLVWSSKKYGSEGEHRQTIYGFTRGFDLLLAVDADEVFDTEQLRKGLEVAAVGVHRNYGISGYINLWRSFNHACYDGFLPIRVINLKNQHKEMSSLPVTIWHFSCCQTKKIMEYKYLIHGHKDEIRPNWLQDFYYSDRMIDLHPVAIGIWNATEYNKELMPSYLKEHPYFNLERV